MLLLLLPLLFPFALSSKLYFVVYLENGLTFANAMAQCKLRDGGILAHIKSAEEASQAMQVLGSAELAWIALTRSASEWRWLDTTTPVAYSNWKLQDNDNNDADNCAAVSRGEWRMQHCTNALLHHALCEVAARVHGPVAFTLLNSPQRSWTSAQSTCVNRGGVLAKINSMEQVLLAQNVIGTVNAWIGLSRLNLPGFQWQDGTEIGPFTYWNTGRPGTSASCVEMISSTGRWSDNTCPTTRPFICEFPRISASFQQCPVRHTHTLMTANETATFPANSTLWATLTCGDANNNTTSVRVLYVIPQVSGMWLFQVAGSLEIRKSCFGRVLACAPAGAPSARVFLEKDQEYMFLVVPPMTTASEVTMQALLVAIHVEPEPVLSQPNNPTLTCPNSFDLSFGSPEYPMVAQYRPDIMLTTNLSCGEQTTSRQVQVIYFTPLVSGVWQLQAEVSFDAAAAVMEIRESCFGSVQQCSSNNPVRPAVVVALTKNVRYAVLIGVLQTTGNMLELNYLGPVTPTPSTQSPSANPTTTLQPTTTPPDNNFNPDDPRLIIGLCGTIGAATGLFAFVLLYQQRQQQKRETMVMIPPAVLNVRNPGYRTETMMASPPPPPPSESYEDYAEKQVPPPPSASPSKFFLRAPRGFHSQATDE